MEIDYITWFWTIGFLLATPLLRTKTFLDYWLMFAWIYAVIHPHISHLYPISLNMQIMIEKHQWELMLLIALFSLLMKSHLSSVRIKKWLMNLGIFNIALSLMAVALVPVCEVLLRFKYIETMPILQFVSGLIPNKSMNAVLLVMLLPYVLMHSDALVRCFLFMITVFLVIMAKSSCAYLALSTYIFVDLFFFSKIPKKYPVIILVVMGVIGVFCLPESMVTGGRFQNYVFFFSDIKLNAVDKIAGFNIVDWLVGRGPASFFTYGAKLQNIAARLDNGYGIWMHSDPLQYIYDYGVLGVPLLLATIWETFKRGQRTEILALSGLLAGSLFYYPFHFAPHVLVWFLIMKLVVNNKKEVCV